MRLRHAVLLTGAISALLFPTAPAATGAVAKIPQVTPAVWTPSIANSGTDGSTEQIRQIVPCGGMMYAVGRFTVIRQGGVNYSRPNVFSFNASTGAVSGWNPVVNGLVNSIALSSNCATAYIGGAFSKVHGAPSKDIASVNTSNSLVNLGFKRSTSGQVSALLTSGNHVLVGGFFTSINGSAKRYFASLNPSTGSDDGYVNLNISGSYSFTDQGGMVAVANPTRVFNFALNPLKNRLLVMGVFTSVGGQARRQIFMLSLNAANTVVHPWYSTEFNQNCAYNEPFWLQDASWAPDGTRIFIAATGYKPATGAGYPPVGARAGLCDSAASFPTTPGLTTHQWVNYTGCDSLYSTAADSSAVYIAGHERYAGNSFSCDGAGVGSTAAPGMGGLSPSSGALTYNPTRGRGLGADDMVVTSAGLWVASDNFDGTNDCGGKAGHPGLCFLPY